MELLSHAEASHARDHITIILWTQVITNGLDLGEKITKHAARVSNELSDYSSYLFNYNRPTRSKSSNSNTN